jgi:hypothetical protein
VRAPGELGSVVERLQFLTGRPVVLMTFVADLIAMIFGNPGALFPALAQGQYRGGPGTAGLLFAASAAHVRTPRSINFDEVCTWHEVPCLQERTVSGGL